MRGQAARHHPRVYAEKLRGPWTDNLYHNVRGPVAGSRSKLPLVVRDVCCMEVEGTVQVNDVAVLSYFMPCFAA